MDGANASAVVYTMLEMAKAHGLNIYGYLKFLLEHRPSENMTDEQLAELAPWSEKIQSIKNRMWIIVNYSNSQRDGVILYFTALLFGAYLLLFRFRKKANFNRTFPEKGSLSRFTCVLSKSSGLFEWE